MLTAAESVIEYRGQRAVPDQLLRQQHIHYTKYAMAMLDIYTNGINKLRQDLHSMVDELFTDEDDCPAGRIRAFCKILDESSRYRSSLDAADRRMEIFSDPSLPSVDTEDLYPDYPGFMPLESFEGFESPDALLSKYNVAQLQSALFRAKSMTLELRSDFKRVIRNINLSRLLHSINPLPDGGYIIGLSGPISPIRPTNRYGPALGRFLPSLLACSNWSLTASLIGPWSTPATLQISSDDGYRSHLPEQEMFDSRLEEEFALEFGTTQQGWKLEREAEILHRNQKVFIPDFVLNHTDGTKIFVEIAGFWTPEYLADKKYTLDIFREHNILLIVPAKLQSSYEMLNTKAITYSNKINIGDVIDAIESMRANLHKGAEQDTEGSG